LASGETVTLSTAGAVQEPADMTRFEQFLHVLSDPNVAYILFTLATIGLVTEISSPGLIFPGVVGGICLILAFYALGVLDAYWGGVALMLLAVGLFVAEYFTTSFGALTAGGVAALVLGSIVLFSKSPGIHVDRGLIVVVAVGATAFSVFILGAIIRGQRRRKATGAEGMIGTTAIARTPLTPRGTVLAEGELWTAIAEGGPVAPGDEVTILAVERMELRVRRRSPACGVQHVSEHRTLLRTAHRPARAGRLPPRGLDHRRRPQSAATAISRSRDARGPDRHRSHAAHAGRHRACGR